MLTKSFCSFSFTLQYLVFVTAADKITGGKKSLTNSFLGQSYMTLFM